MEADLCHLCPNQIRVKKDSFYTTLKSLLKLIVYATTYTSIINLYQNLIFDCCNKLK